MKFKIVNTSVSKIKNNKRELKQIMTYRLKNMNQYSITKKK